MTIKEFAELCGCNAQTLRYYDRIDLLKPVKIDEWSGYRYYNEEQAIAFVKIKNLQLAGFSIEEIKALIGEADDKIYQAFEDKILEQKEKLEIIKRIQKSYQNEMNTIETKLKEIQDRVHSEMEKYDPKEEFGIDEATYQEIMKGVVDTFESIATEGNYEDYEFEEFRDDALDMEERYDFFENPDYEIVYEKHDWEYAKEFLDECLDLEDSVDYNYVFKVTEGKANNSAFANIVLGLAIKNNGKDPNRQRGLGCTVTNSKDGKNHFWLFRKK